MSRNHRGKKSPLNAQQINQRKALNYYIRMFAYFDREKKEITNTLTSSENMALLTQCFGYFDSAVVPSHGFDGCVISAVNYDGEKMVLQKNVLKIAEIDYDEERVKLSRERVLSPPDFK